MWALPKGRLRDQAANPPCMLNALALQMSDNKRRSGTQGTLFAFTHPTFPILARDHYVVDPTIFPNLAALVALNNPKY
jgi:hypothetical protein